MVVSESPLATDACVHCHSVLLCSQLKQVVDVGDFVGVRGGVKKTDRGEISVVVRELTILTKSLRPLPEKWHGLADIEKRYRQRWVSAACPTSPSEHKPCGHDRDAGRGKNLPGTGLSWFDNPEGRQTIFFPPENLYQSVPVSDLAMIVTARCGGHILGLPGSIQN